VIYGRNGSGKTTLSEALRLAAVGKADLSTVKARVVVNGAVSTIDLGPTTMPFRLFVYNRYYVEDSLHLFLDGRGEALPILKLGERNVQSEIEVRRMQDYLTVLEQRQRDLASQVKAIESDRETIEKQTKADIIAALAPADSAYYNPTRYQMPIVKQRLNNESGVSLSDSQLAVEQAAATARTLDPVPKVASAPAVAPGLRDTINDELLGIAVESVRLPRLSANAALSEWIEAGVSLHQEGDLCAFCQVGTVTAATLDAYRQHFSAALEELRNRLTKAIAYL
jgi:wobble nucleotide-excising tRNase